MRMFAKWALPVWIVFLSLACTGVDVGADISAEDADKVMRGISHRGWTVTAPENTLPAFILSRKAGFRYVETDIRFTADGVAVLLHDETVDRTTDGSGAVGEMRLEQVRRLECGKMRGAAYAGTGIPTLEEFLDLCVEWNLRPYLELKEGTKGQIEAVVGQVHACGLQETTRYISTSPERLEYVIGADPAADVGYLVVTPNEHSIRTVLDLQTGSNTVFIDSSDFSEQTVSLCREAGVPLEVWVIDSEETIRSLSPYISGVTSNLLHAGRVRFGMKPV